MSSKTKCWLWMLLVILSETSATSTLKMFDNSEGMTKTLLLALIVVLYCICYYSLSRAVKDIPVGLAYATWSGTGTALLLRSAQRIKRASRYCSQRLRGASFRHAYRP